MPRDREAREFTLIVPLDASGIKDFKPDRAVKVVAYDRKGRAHEATVKLDARGHGKAELTLPAAGGLRVLVGPEKATAEELKGLQTIGTDVSARQWQNKTELTLQAIPISAYYWRWWWWWCRDFKITGRVVCADGSPVPGAQVCVYDVDWWWWWWWEEKLFENYFPQRWEDPEVRRVEAMLQQHHSRPAQKIRFHVRSHFRQYGELAAVMVLVVASLFYVWSVHRQQSLMIAHNQLLQAELARQQDSQSIVALTLNAGQVMGISGQQIAISRSTQQVRIEVAPIGIPARKRRIYLQTQNGDEIASFVLPPDAPLTFDVPGSALQPGYYNVVVSWDANEGKQYSFRVIFK